MAWAEFAVGLAFGAFGSWFGASRGHRELLFAEKLSAARALQKAGSELFVAAFMSLVLETQKEKDLARETAEAFRRIALEHELLMSESVSSACDALHDTAMGVLLDEPATRDDLRGAHEALLSALRHDLVLKNLGRLTRLLTFSGPSAMRPGGSPPRPKSQR